MSKFEYSDTNFWSTLVESTQASSCQQKGSVVAYNRIVFKGAVVTMIVLLVGMLVLDNVMIDAEQGLVTRGNLELSWTAANENSDEASDQPIAGYTIHCWNVENQKTVVVRDPTASHHRIDRLWPGTYRCAMSTIQADGSESSLSNAVTKVVH